MFASLVALHRCGEHLDRLCPNLCAGLMRRPPLPHLKFGPDTLWLSFWSPFACSCILWLSIGFQFDLDRLAPAQMENNFHLHQSSVINDDCAQAVGWLQAGIPPVFLGLQPPVRNGLLQVGIRGEKIRRFWPPCHPDHRWTGSTFPWQRWMRQACTTQWATPLTLTSPAHPTGNRSAYVRLCPQTSFYLHLRKANSKENRSFCAQCL